MKLKFDTMTSLRGLLSIGAVVSQFQLMQVQAMETTPSLDASKITIRQDFPNYFAFLSDDEASSYVEQSFTSILQRLKIPHVDPDSNIFTDEQFMEKLNKYTQRLAPGAKIYISGGVVRSLLGYMYKKVYNAHQRFLFELNALPSDEQMKGVVCSTFEKIIKGQSWKHCYGQDEKRMLPALRALGINSDLDVLIDFPEDFEGDKEKVLSDLTVFINSAECHLGLRNNKGEIKKSIVPIGDVKDYEEQLGDKGKRSAVNQGGSTLDWLAFPIDQQEPQQLKFPEGFPKILTCFLDGKLEYLKAPKKMDDLDKQTVRGLRPFLEIPFLLLTEDGAKVMEDELQLLIKKVRKGGRLSPGAMEQLEKMIRNARFEGGHNRFVKGGSQGNSEISGLVQELCLLIRTQSGDKKIQLIPEFLVNRKIGLRRDDKGSLRENGCLLSLDEFVEKYTDRGIIYHGTPEINTILYMIRNGLVVSSNDQGTAIYGRGTYADKRLSEAQSYAKTYGVVLPFQINAHENLRILDLNTDKGKKLLESIALKHPDKDAHQVLEVDYDIDVIIAENVNYLLLQNADAIKFSKDAKILIQAQLDKVKREIQEKTKDDAHVLTEKDIEKWMEYTYPNRGYTQLMRYLEPTFTSESFEIFLKLLERGLEKGLSLPFCIIYKIMSEKPVFSDIKNENLLHFMRVVHMKAMEIAQHKFKNVNDVLSALLKMESLGESGKATISDVLFSIIEDAIDGYPEKSKANELTDLELEECIENFILNYKYLKKLTYIEVNYNKNTKKSIKTSSPVWEHIMNPIIDSQNIDNVLKNIEALNKNRIGAMDQIGLLKYVLPKINKVEFTSDQIDFLVGLNDLNLLSPRYFHSLIDPLCQLKNPESILSVLRKMVEKGISIEKIYLDTFLKILDETRPTDQSIDFMSFLQKLGILRYSHLADLISPINAIKNYASVSESIKKIADLSPTIYVDCSQSLVKLFQVLDNFSAETVDNALVFIRKINDSTLYPVIEKDYKGEKFQKRAQDRDVDNWVNCTSLSAVSEAFSFYSKLDEKKRGELLDSVAILSKLKDIKCPLGEDQTEGWTLFDLLSYNNAILQCVFDIRNKYPDVQGLNYSYNIKSSMKLAGILSQFQTYESIFALFDVVKESKALSNISLFDMLTSLRKYTITPEGLKVIKCLLDIQPMTGYQLHHYIEPLSKLTKHDDFISLINENAEIVKQGGRWHEIVEIMKEEQFRD